MSSKLRTIATRAGVAVAAGVGLASTLGCGLIPGVGSGQSPVGEPSTSPPYTYNSDATGEVVGTNCRYDDQGQKFKYDLSIQNASADHVFKYSISVDVTGGDSEFADDSLASVSEEVTVAAGKERKLTLTAGYPVPDHRIWFGCSVRSATKTLAD
jgi:hypothetical protein